MSTPNPATTNWVPLWDLNGGVNINYRGAYVAATQYVDGDVVIYQGVTYMCCRPTLNAPAAAPPPWPLPSADTAWHLVGGSGEPAFQNGWVNYDVANFPPARFRKLASGLVVVSGLIKNGTIAGPPTGTCFTLPVGYRPIQQMHIMCVGNASFAYSHVGADGQITCNLQNLWYSLDNIRFPAEQ